MKRFVFFKRIKVWLFLCLLSFSPEKESKFSCIPSVDAGIGTSFGPIYAVGLLSDSLDRRLLSNCINLYPYSGDMEK